MDIILLIVMVIIVERSTRNGKRSGEMSRFESIMGSLILSFFLYSFAKVLIMGVGWGFQWKFPMTYNPVTHQVSGILAVVIWAFLLLYRPIPKLRAWIGR